MDLYEFVPGGRMDGKYAFGVFHLAAGYLSEVC